MARKVLSIVLLLSMLVIIAGFFLKFSGDPGAYIVWNIGGGIFLVAGTILLAKEGSYLGSAEFKLTGVPVAILIIGSMFKIMHWPFAGALIAVGMGGVSLLYFIHFIRKKTKQLPDFGKLIFVTGFLAGRFLVIMHLDKGREISFFALMILVLLVTRSFAENNKLKGNIA